MEKTRGKTQMQRRNMYIYIFTYFLKRDLGLGVALSPEFSWKLYLMLQHDPSLTLI